MALADCDDLAPLARIAEQLCLAGHGTHVSFSKKVFIPLTQLCRDVCHYCTFASRRAGRAGVPVARGGTGDRARGPPPAARRRCSRSATSRSCATRRRARRCRARLRATLEYLERRRRGARGDRPAAAPEPGRDDAAGSPRCARCRRRWASCWRRVRAAVAARRAALRLARQGAGASARDPGRRRRARVPFTTGLLIGIGETRRERLESLLAMRDLHERHGHLQEIIIQNFRAKPDTRMARAPEPALEEQLWTIAVARLDLRAVDVDAGAAEPAARRAAAARRRRHQRLGRGVAGHAGPRQSGGALAALPGWSGHRAAGGGERLRSSGSRVSRSGSDFWLRTTRSAIGSRCALTRSRRRWSTRRADAALPHMDAGAGARGQVVAGRGVRAAADAQIARARGRARRRRRRRSRASSARGARRTT